MNGQRRYSTLDRFLINLDLGFSTLFADITESARDWPNPATPPPVLSEQDRVLSARLMRVNHAGEVAAQGLYQGQALTARARGIRGDLERAAREESDHLAWCARRITELEGRKSLLNPVWYVGSLAIGACAGAAGDRWNLGFLAETERQVVAHLNSHLERLPIDDIRSRAIVTQMMADEAAHAALAMDSGGAPLPGPVRRLMALAAKVMTATAERV